MAVGYCEACGYYNAHSIMCLAFSRAKQSALIQDPEPIKASEMKYGETITDVVGHKKPLDWDPNKRTPFNHFPDWRGKSWDIDHGWSTEDINNHAYNQNGAVHPLQKG